MKKITLLLTILIASASAEYDYRTGSNYSTSKNYDGSTNVQGYNYNTGSSWSTRIEKNGDMSGRDARGNMWNYNSSTKTGINYGTGKITINGDEY